MFYCNTRNKGASMNVLVTGGSGFIGKHLVPCLQARGHDVTVLCRQKIERPINWGQQTEIILFDLDTIYGDLPRSILKHDAVVHLAWPNLPNYQETVHFERTLPNQMRFLTSLIRGGVKQILGAGTCLEYGMVNGRLSENMWPKPTNSYGMAKDALFRFVSTVAQEAGATFKWARLFYMYGEGQGDYTLMGQLYNAIRCGEASFNMSGGEQLRDFLEVTDVVNLLVSVLEHDKFSGPINICSGQPVSVRSLVEAEIKKLGASINLNLGYYPYPKHEPMAFWGDRRQLDQLLSSTVN